MSSVLCTFCTYPFHWDLKNWCSQDQIHQFCSSASGESRLSLEQRKEKQKLPFTHSFVALFTKTVNKKHASHANCLASPILQGWTRNFESIWASDPQNALAQPSSHSPKHLPPNSLRSVHRRTHIDQSTGKVRENNLLATSSSMWQTKDYYFNEKYYSKTLNPKKTQWRHFVHI